MTRIRPCALVLVIFLCGCSQTAGERRPSWPTLRWPTAPPQEQGLAEAPLASLDREFAQGKHGYVDAMLIVRHGYVVFDRSYERDYDTPYQGKDHFPGPYNYFNPDWHPYYQRGALHTLQSVTKSVTSAVFGAAAGRGEAPGIDEKMLRFFEGIEIDNLDDRKRAITVRHLLTMTAGFDWDEHSIPYEDPRNPAVQMEQSSDWVRFAINRPMAHTPGTAFAYNSGVSQLLSFIFKQATGRDIDEYATEHLFKPLGITDHYWKKTPQGLTDTEGGLYLSPADLAKIGYLYLENGTWAAKQIIPQEWIRASVTPQVQDTGRDGVRYGYQWWLTSHPASSNSYVYTGSGYGGQILFVFPEHDLVAVFMGWNIYGRPSLNSKFVLGRLLEALESGR